MTSFLIAIAVLIGGYFVYGAIAERVFGLRLSKPTPAYSRYDGVDYMPLPTWKVFLIQFLNIAGLGPIFGAIMGIMFGPAAFIWIVLGTIFAGAVHDFTAAMISMRSGGASLPESIGRELGKPVMKFVRGWSVVLLVLVGAVFVINPAGLLANLTHIDRLVWIVVIFGYYMLATLLPIDKLISNIYPLFGVTLLFMAAGLLGVLLIEGWPGGAWELNTGFSDGLGSRFADESHPIFPMMFVSIACGAISGFHATQSPMMARCMKNERLARPIFYGAMVAEGLVALIWAAAAIAFAHGYDGLSKYVSDYNAANPGGAAASAIVNDICRTWLGDIGGILAVIGVIAAPITTGDTALRSTRMMVAEFMHIDQSRIVKRLLVSVPIFILTFLVMCIDFNILWRYFAWCNQTLAVFTLWAATVYLARHRKAYIITLLPAMFMSAVSVSYVLFAPRPEGFGLDWSLAIGAGVAVAIGLLLLFMKYQRGLSAASTSVMIKAD